MSVCIIVWSVAYITVHNLPSSQNYPITSVHHSGKAGQKIILIPGGMGLGRGGVGGGGEDIPKIEWVKSEKLVGSRQA